MTDMNR